MRCYTEEQDKLGERGLEELLSIRPLPQPSIQCTDFVALSQPSDEVLVVDRLRLRPGEGSRYDRHGQQTQVWFLRDGR